MICNIFNPFLRLQFVCKWNSEIRKAFRSPVACSASLLFCVSYIVDIVQKRAACQPVFFISILFIAFDMKQKGDYYCKTTTFSVTYVLIFCCCSGFRSLHRFYILTVLCVHIYKCAFISILNSMPMPMFGCCCSFHFIQNIKIPDV